MHDDLSQFARYLCGIIPQFVEGKAGDEEFSRLALNLFRLQIRHNPAYARLCGDRAAGSISDWTQIPAAPTVAFKEMEMTSLAPEERTTIFSSSGTTNQQRSRHFHSSDSLAVYEESLYRWFRYIFREDLGNIRWLFLTPTDRNAPTSSLAHMFGTIASRLRGSESVFAGTVDFNDAWSLDYNKIAEFLREERPGKSVAILGTAFLFVNLVDEFERKGIAVRLPPGSWAMETGGYKGRTREMSKEELHASISRQLGVARDRIFGEYGMSELSSQAYAGPDGVFRFPPWARVQIISPATGREAREGEPGLIRVYDLANVWSVMAVQTEDIGIRCGDGFRLVGRAKEAEARGCSLMTV